MEAGGSSGDGGGKDEADQHLEEDQKLLNQMVERMRRDIQKPATPDVSNKSDESLFYVTGSAQRGRAVNRVRLRRSKPVASPDKEELERRVRINWESRTPFVFTSSRVLHNKSKATAADSSLKRGECPG